MSLLTSANDGTMCPAAPLWRQADMGPAFRAKKPSASVTKNPTHLGSPK
ncbi:hypothetical protein NC651_011366 [Populus alba x Populus x berolinensis]|nr:hypothetical protein NC651_011366 [Populus alba x Populus x berolinensis]